MVWTKQGNIAGASGVATGMAWRRWRKAIANRAAAPVDIVWIGDSITDSYVATDDAHSFLRLLGGRLQSLFNPIGVHGSQGYVPAYKATAGLVPDQWSRTATVVLSDFGIGLGRTTALIRSNANSGSNDNQTITFTGDRFWLLFYGGGGGYGTMGVTIDGGALINVAPNSAGEGQLYDSGPLTRGSHTVVVTAPGTPAAGNVVLEGIMVFDGDGGATFGSGTGIRVWDGGHAGFATSNFAQAGQVWPGVLTKINPALIGILLGANDMNLGVSAATFQTNLQAIINIIVGAVVPAPTILLMTPWLNPSVASGTEVAFQQAVRSVAIANPNTCVLVSTGLTIGNPDTSAPWVSATNTHPNNVGHRLLADTLFRTIVGIDDLVPAVSGFQVFTLPGILITGLQRPRLRFPVASTILGISAAVDTAPTGSTAIVDILKNGTTIYGTNSANRPTINAGAFVSNNAGGGSNGESVPDTTAMAAGDYLQINPTQVGSTIAGADLTVTVRYSTP